MVHILYNPAEVLKNLRGVDFPADREKIIAVAKRNNAPADVTALLLSDLPEYEYNGPREVLEALTEIARERELEQ